MKDKYGDSSPSLTAFRLNWLTSNSTRRVGSVVIPNEVQGVLSQVLQLVGDRDSCPAL